MNNDFENDMQPMQPAPEPAPVEEAVSEAAQEANGQAEAVPQSADQAAWSVPCGAPLPNWGYGARPQRPPEDPEQKKNSRRGTVGFFAVFGGVLLVALLLLFLTLFLGEGGFSVTENVNIDRTVYVREDGTVVGKYTPGEVVDLLSPSTVTVIVKGAATSGFGSGFIYSAEGYIITNHHVIDADGVEVQVMMHDGKVYDATVVGSNAAADVAVLKISADRTLTPVKLGNSNAVLVGESVAAIGTPVDMNYQNTATFGRISAASRIVTFEDASGNVTKRMYVLQTDTSVNPGNSGGPLVNLDGEVIGVVVMKLMGSSTEYYEGLGFALPINGVVKIADEIIEKGSFTGTNPIAKGRLLLGVTAHAVVKDYWYKQNADNTFDVSMSYVEGYTQMPVSGVHVISTQPGSGAYGVLREGDIIIKADGLRVLNTLELIGVVNRRESGYGVTLTVLRDGTEMNLVVNLNEEPLQ